ncbi:tigger transposable element-derived protein 4 [Ditylenchus destructor]|uniref:Tigger transposable element-derived protein 4 n=1 Tax=Ditylenchus destructor TaxID=166010 RepID=A0AAD4R762_9BILA|nr:tigger transposable element-derived protein 4 [Ditylenchus destructor]
MDPSHLEPSGSASPTPSRKQRAITLGVKKQVIDTLSSQNMSRTDVAKKFGIPRTTLKSILSQKEKIIRAMDEGADGKRIRLKNGKHVDLEKVLLRWVRIVKRHGGPITGNILKVNLVLFDIVDFIKSLFGDSFQFSGGPVKETFCSKNIYIF